MTLDVWKRKRTLIKSKLTRFKNLFAEYDQSLGIGTWSLQLSKIEILYTQFSEVQTEIQMSVGEREQLQESHERNEFEAAYFGLMLNIKEFIERTRQGGSSVSAATRSFNSVNEIPAQSSSINELANLLSVNSLTSNLPMIKIPKFDGSYENWVKFRDPYKTMVHDRVELTNIQKFHYLDNALTGGAARTIQTLGVSDANYETAWQNLWDRYEDSQALVHFHLDAFLGLPVLSNATLSNLRQFIDDANNNLLALKSLGENTEGWNTIIIHVLSSKLDSSTRKDWERCALAVPGKPTFREMIEFLENHCKFLERVPKDKPEIIQNLNSQKKFNVKVTSAKSSERRTSHATTKRICPICQESHTLYNCEKFRALSVSSRIDEVRKLRFCFNRLTPGHQNRQCYAGPCNKCHKKHNALFHLDYEMRESRDKEQGRITSSELEPMKYQLSKTTLVTNSNHSSTDEDIILGTAIIWVEDSSGNRHGCRASLDSCSQVHLMTQEFCQRLKLPVSNSNIVVSGVFKSTQEPQFDTSVKFNSRSTNYSKQITCLVTPAITDDMPNLPVHRKDFEIPEGLVLADPAFDRTRPVDLLIGAGIFWNLMCVGQIHLRRDQPILQKTKLGWIVAGPMQVPIRKKRAVCNLITNQQLHSDMERFWEIENHFVKRNIPELDSQDDLEQHFMLFSQRLNVIKTADSL